MPKKIRIVEYSLLGQLYSKEEIVKYNVEK